eukprot:TRINITY_DN179_c0_g1_i14.p1 TRINITY_DN179_c0_g1~~TRINITY_DN179_c0_g1_i14.p1  ORF type:complete len:331 (+),score=72.88 TRINITY_DN179_c0_g1_i14:544-1536(+)
MHVKILYPGTSVDENERKRSSMEGKGPRTSPWLPRHVSSSVVKVGFHPSVPSWLLSHLSLVDLPCSVGIPVSNQQEKWPLIIFSHGLKGVPEVYMTPAISWASRGFIVCCLLHTDGSSAMSYDKFALDDHVARSQQLNIRSLNTSYAIDQLSNLDQEHVLYNRIDLDRIAVVGHSFGGATAVKSVKDDSRVKCGIGLDPWLFPLDQNDKKRLTTTPLLFIASYEWQWKENLERMKMVMESSSGGGGRTILIKGMGHLNFSDVPFFAHPTVLTKGKVIGNMSRNDGLALIMAHTVPFLIESLGLTENSLYQTHVQDSLKIINELKDFQVEV